MSLPTIGLKPSQLLVYSAATNTGMHTVQQAHLLYPTTYTIAIASTQHHSRLQALGADVCFDYKSPTIEKDVKALGKNVTRAIDCHSEGPSTVSCARLMGDAGGEGPHGRIVRTLPPGMIQGTVPQGVRANEWILSYTALGKVCLCFIHCSLHSIPSKPLISHPAPLHPHYSLPHPFSDFYLLVVLPAILVPVQTLPRFANRLRHRKQEPKTAHRTIGGRQG